MPIIKHCAHLSNLIYLIQTNPSESVFYQVPIIKMKPLADPLTNGVTAIYHAIGKALKAICIELNKLCIYLAIPEEDGDNTPFNKMCLVFMVIYLCCLAAQDDAVNNFKCGCSKIQDLTYAKRCAVGPMKVQVVIEKGQDPFCSEKGHECSGGYCTSHWAGQACTNPYANPLTKTVKVSHSMTASEEEWASQRASMCFQGFILHMIFLGWGAFFFAELVIRFIGHQGATNFFLTNSTYQKKNDSDMPPKGWKPTRIPHVDNILDTVCILITVAGIVLTELTFGEQVLNANISLRYTHGEPDWSILTPTGPRSLKFLRLAIVIRVAYRVIPLISSIPIVAVILRGFRGASQIMFAGLLVLVFVFFFAMFGRELFRYYGPAEGCNECLECEETTMMGGLIPMLKCVDVCSNTKYEGCTIFKSEEECNPNICFWTPPPKAKVAAYARSKKLAEDADDPAAALANLKEPEGSCAWDYSKGGRCGANMAMNHFKATSQATFDTLTEAVLLLFDIVVGANWYSSTVEGVESMGIIGMTFFLIFFYLANFQFLRLFVCIIASNYELEEDEKFQAQEMILMHVFDEAKEIKTKSKYHTEYSKEKLDDTFNPVGMYDQFSFNKHYLELLRGAQLSLRELLEAQKGNLSSLMKKEELDEDPSKGKGYESDSEDEEEDPRVVYYETDQIAKLLTINTVKKDAMAAGKGAMLDDDEPGLLQRAQMHVKKFIDSKPFSYFIILTVIFSIVAVVIRLPSALETYSSFAFLAIFVLEVLLKWFAMGVCGRGGYFSDNFCKLDFFLVLLQIFDILENQFHFAFDPGDPNADIVKGFRSLRAARLITKLQAAISALGAIMLAIGICIYIVTCTHM